MQRLVLCSHAIESYFECPRLPYKSVEHVDGASSILGCGQEHGAVSSTAIVGSQRDICAQYCASTTEEIFEVLPADAVGEVSDEELSACVARW